MKIEVDIPDKYEKRNIYIFAGMEPVARRRQNGWELKTSDCSRCGECCLAINEDHPLGTPHGCRYLNIDPYGGQNLCGLGIFRPYGCAIAELDMIKECTVRWEPIK